MYAVCTYFLNKYLIHRAHVRVRYLLFQFKWNLHIRICTYFLVYVLIKPVFHFNRAWYRPETYWWKEKKSTGEKRLINSRTSGCIRVSKIKIKSSSKINFLAYNGSVNQSTFTNARILKPHSHSMSGGSIWASLKCHCCFWIAGGLVVA
jgi:hypothetical protein